MTAGPPLRPGAAGAAALLAPVAARAQVLGHGTDPVVDLPRVLAGLAFCLLLAVAAALLLRRRQLGGASAAMPRPAFANILGPLLQAPGSGRLKVVERLRLNPHLELCLVSCDGREVLLAATPTGGFVVTPPPADGPAV